METLSLKAVSKTWVLAESLAEVLRTGLENPYEVSGTVAIVLQGQDERVTLWVDLAHNAQTQVYEQAPATADAQMVMPVSTAERVLAEQTFVDFRDPDIIGTVEASGALGLINHIAKALVRPSEAVLKRFEQVGQLHAEKNYQTLTQIDVLESPSQIELLEAIEDSRPVLIHGFAEQAKWDLDALCAAYGESVVRVRSASQRQTLREFVEELRAFEANPYQAMIEGFVKPYTEGAALPEAMHAAFGPLFFNREDFTPPQLWLGSVPVDIPTSSLHRDPLSGFLFQVMGRKRLDLYSADQSPKLYPHKAYNNYQPCWVKPESPDLARFPAFAKAKKLSVVLEPGECLLQPAGWFHQVYALDSPNMSVSYFWRYA